MWIGLCQLDTQEWVLKGENGSQCHSSVAAGGKWPPACGCWECLDSTFRSQNSLAGYGQCRCKELHTTEYAHMHISQSSHEFHGCRVLMMLAAQVSAEQNLGPGCTSIYDLQGESLIVALWFPFLQPFQRFWRDIIFSLKLPSFRNIQSGYCLLHGNMADTSFVPQVFRILSLWHDCMGLCTHFTEDF